MPESKIQINGDSTLKKFSATAKNVELQGEAKSNENKQDSLAAGQLSWTPTLVKMILEVKKLKSGDEILDDHMYENLKADKFPEIQLKLTEFSFSNAIDGEPTSVLAKGTLTVAGVEKPIELKATVSLEGLNFKIKGNKSVLMSDYGITPPTMMLGTLKTRDEIEISFDVIGLIEGKKRG